MNGRVSVLAAAEEAIRQGLGHLFQRLVILDLELPALLVSQFVSQD